LYLNRIESDTVGTFGHSTSLWERCRIV